MAHRDGCRGRLAGARRERRTAGRGRPFGILFGWDVRHPFQLRPSYESVAHLPLAERLGELRRPEIRARILAERPGGTTTS